MFKLKNLTALALVAAVFGLTTIEARGADGAGSPASKKKEKTAVSPKRIGRGLASLGGPSAKMGQGEQMLYNVKTSSPRFLRAAKSTSPVKIAGACRDAYGVTYNSSEKGYESCLTSRSVSTGSMNEYFGAAQRQAGVGILVGN